MSTATDVCRIRLERFMRRELADWDGLPQECSERDLEQWLPLRPGEGIVHLGSDIVEYRFRVAADTVGFPEPVRFHFSGGALSLIRTGIWSFDRAECERLLQHLGPPSERLSLMFGMGTIPDGEWVYAAIGLNLGVIPETGLIASVSAYQPCDIDVYLRRFQEIQPVREFPRR
jgi:hypothetical protein